MLPRLPSTRRNLDTAASVQDAILPELEGCSIEILIVVRQPEVSAQDFANERAMPHLRQLVTGSEKTIKSTHIVKNLKGSLDTKSIQRRIAKRCGAKHIEIDGSSRFLSLSSGVTIPAKADSFVHQ